MAQPVSLAFATILLLILLVLLAVPHAAKGRRLARLFRAQREWAVQMDRRA